MPCKIKPMSGKRIYKGERDKIGLLDATYKTTKYDITLLFITVKTNVLFSGSFILFIYCVQTENTCSICEALKIFKDWNQI